VVRGPAGGGRTVYHMPSAHRLEGALDAAALRRALDELVRRHEALRTALPEGPDGVPVQRILPPFSVPLPVHDLSGVAEAERAGRSPCGRPSTRPSPSTWRPGRSSARRWCAWRRGSTSSSWTCTTRSATAGPTASSCGSWRRSTTPSAGAGPRPSRTAAPVRRLRHLAAPLDGRAGDGARGGALARGAGGGAAPAGAPRRPSQACGPFARGGLRDPAAAGRGAGAGAAARPRGGGHPLHGAARRLRRGARRLGGGRGGGGRNARGRKDAAGAGGGRRPLPQLPRPADEPGR
jgi:hypothetical protein